MKKTREFEAVKLGCGRSAHTQPIDPERTICNFTGEDCPMPADPIDCALNIERREATEK